MERSTELGLTYLALSAYSGLTIAYRLTNAECKARQTLAKGFALCESVGNRTARHQLEWSAGLLSHEGRDYAQAEDYLRTAWRGLIREGEIGYSAVVALDLILLLVEQGRLAETIEVARAALPGLEALRLRGESLVTVRMLREAIKVNELNISLLRSARDAISEDRGGFQPRACNMTGKG